MVNSLTPSSPHPTESPALSRPKISRAPIQNPFDKFTQSDYDAWIAKLIGRIDKALAYDDIPSPQKFIPFLTAEASYAGSFMPKPVQESEDDLDSNIEDSFAQVKARRVNKGKARDPREGPGLCPDFGRQNKPIEILSDEDEQDDGQVIDSERSEDDEEEEEAYDEDEYESEDEDEEQVGTSAWAEGHWNRRKHVETDEGEEYYEGYDEESNQAASVRREGPEQDIDFLSDMNSTVQQQEEEQFLSDEESADTHSSSPQFDDYVDGMRSSPPQFDEDDISDKVTSFSDSCKRQLSTSDVLPNVQSPWSQVENHAEGFHIEGDVILPRADKQDPPSAHDLSVKDDISATEFLFPDVVSDDEYVNSDQEEGESGEWESNESDEDEEFDESAGVKDSNDIVEENSREQEVDEVHLLDKLRPSHACGPFDMSYLKGSQFLGSGMKSGPGTNEEPIMIDSDDDEEIVAPRPRPIASVPQSQLEHTYSADREGYAEKEEFGLYEGQEEEEEEEEYISDGSINAVYADRQGQEPIDVKVMGDQSNGAQKLDVEDGVQEVSGKSKPSDEIVADIQTNKFGSASEHNSGRAVWPTPSAEDVQTYRIVDPLFFPDSTQNETSVVESIAEESVRVACSIARIIEQSTCDNIVDWRALPNFLTSLGQSSSTIVGHHEISSARPVPALATANASTELQTANIDAPSQHTVTHMKWVPTINDNDIVLLEDPEKVETRMSEEGRAEEKESRKGEKKRVIDIDDKMDELDGSEGEDGSEEEDGNQPGVATFVLGDLGYPEDDELESQDDELDESEYEDDASRASTPSQVVRAETQARHTSVAEIALEASQDGSDKEVHIFAKHLEDHWDGVSSAESSIHYHAAVHGTNEPMESKFKEFSVFSQSKIQNVDQRVRTDRGITVSTVPAASSILREGVMTEETISDDDAEGRLMVTVEEPVMGELPSILAEEPGIEELPAISLKKQFTDDFSPVLIEEPVTEPASPKELGHQSAPEDETADVTITAIHMDTSYNVEEPTMVSELNVSVDPSSRAISLDLDLMSMRSDQVVPDMEVAIGDIEETVSDIDVESFPKQREETSEEGHLMSFSYDNDDDDDIEIQSILVENQVEVFEVETMVTDVRDMQSTSPGGLDDEIQIHDSARDVPYVTTGRSFITHDVDNTHNASHLQMLSATFIADADGYFVQPGSPMMDRCGSVDFNVTPAQENFPHSPDRSGALPTIIQLPGTPQKVLSPGGTPRLGPTPVSITVDPVILKALKANPGLFSSPATVPTFREQEQLHLSTSVAEDANGNVSPTSKLTVNTAVVEEESMSTVAQESSLDLPSSPVEAPVDKPVGEPITNMIPSLASLQTLFSVDTTQGKPTLPTLYDDPYPYSLSTPGPPNEDEESDEESIEHEKSTSTTSSSVAERSPSSSAARGNKQEDVHYDVGNVKDYPPPLENVMSIRSIVASPSSGGASQAERDDEKGLTGVEAEINEIDQVLADELDIDADLDLDGETDQEFVDAQEENVEEKGDEGVLSTSHKGAGDTVGAHIIMDEDLDERPTNQESKQVKFRVWDNEGVAGKMGKVFNRLAPEEEKDPFKLMGNGSLVAPKEVEESDTKSLKFEDEDEMKLITLTPEEFQLPPDVEFYPVECSPTPGIPQLLPPSHGADLGYVGIIPYNLAAGMSVQDMSSLLSYQWADVPATNRFARFIKPTFVNSLPRYATELATVRRAGTTMSTTVGTSTSDNKLPEAVSTNLSPQVYHQQVDRSSATNRSSLAIEPTLVAARPNHASDLATLSATGQASTIMSTIMGTSTSGNQSPQTISTSSEPRVDIPRKVRISVEDPYQADNDSDHDQGTSALGTKKRKRSRSDVFDRELPTTPAKIIVVSSDDTKGKGKSVSSAKTVVRARRGNRRQDYTSFLRSPSVTPTVASESSIATQSSPSHALLASSEPRPFIHAHSRKKRPKVPTTMKEKSQNQRLASVIGSRSELLKAEDVLTKAPSVSLTNATSPVTRSHCRYHKISISKTENGPRIYFLVPGCCLNDEDLIEEEEIVDDGEAIIRGDTPVVDDIETLDFEAYLHWVLRQLVGSEILRENEVFYLPEPGEEIIRNTRRPEKPEKPERKDSKVVEATADLTGDISPRKSPLKGGSTSRSALVSQQTPEHDGSMNITEAKKTSTELGAENMDGLLTQGETRLACEQNQRDTATYQTIMDSDDQSLSLSDSESTPRGHHHNLGQKRLRSGADVVDEVDRRTTKDPRMWLNHILRL